MKSNLDRDSESIIRNICLSQWKTAMNACCQHEYLDPELTSAFTPRFTRKIGKECVQYSKSDSCLKDCEPSQLCVFSNKKGYQEVRLKCPVLCAAVSSACNLESKVKEEQKLFELRANPS